MIRITAILLVAFAAALVTYVGARLTARLNRSTVAASGIVAAVLFASFLLLRPHSLALANLTVLTAAIFVGSGLGLLLTTKPALVSFSVVASMADIVSASGGITRTLSDAYREGTGDLLLVLSVSVRLEGSIQQVIGIGDLIILATLFSALGRLGYRGPLALFAPLAGMSVALVVGLISGGVSAIPFIAGTTLCYLALAKAETSESA